jgi:hypothetical protein
MRRQLRFHIHASCRFWWSAETGEMNFGCGRTCNLSSRAVCVVSEVVLPVGALVMVEVDIPGPPAHDLSASSGFLLQGEGVVSRQRKDAGEFVIMMTHSTFDRRLPADECGRILTMQL